MLLVALPAICLFHCARPAAGTALENATGQDVRIEVTYRGTDNRTVAVVVAGSAMPLQTPLDRIDAVHYAYGDHHCVLTHDQVMTSAHRIKTAEAAVNLEPCP
ncbi:MAG TPA: hypothetical protein VGL66_08810 [Caulobacteraceae bacterium]|jgi:hypothetical protein